MNKQLLINLQQNSRLVQLSHMNRNSNRQDANSQINRIKANLKEMKDEVNQYLRKQSNDIVPPLLKPRHYLILNCINDFNGTQNNISTENIKFQHDIVGKKRTNPRANNLTPIFKSQSAERHKANVMTKSSDSINFNNSNNSSTRVQQQLNCFQPNICSLNLQIPQKSKPETKGETSRKRLLEHKVNESLNATLLYSLPENDRRYHSIDLSNFGSKSKLESAQGENKILKGNKSSPMADQQLQNYPRNRSNKRALRHSIDSCLSNSAVDNMSLLKSKNTNQSSQIIKEMKEALGAESLLEPSLNQQQSIIKLPMIKRRIYAISIPATNILTKKYLQRNKNSKIFPNIESKGHPLKNGKNGNKITQNNECSPWQEIDDQNEKSQDLLPNSFL